MRFAGNGFNYLSKIGRRCTNCSWGEWIQH